MSCDLDRVCPHRDCAELNPANAVDCHACGTRLVPRTPEEVARHQRIRSAIGETAKGIDPAEYARQIIADLDRLAAQRRR